MTADMDESTTHSRRSVVITGGSIVLTASLAGCTGNGDDDPVDENTVMAGTDDEPFSFVPDEIEVEVGTTVTWEWGTNTHNIEVREQPDDADWPGEPDIYDEGHEYSYTFEVPGTYEYVCVPHEAQDMFGTIIVTE